MTRTTRQTIVAIVIPVLVVLTFVRIATASEPVGRVHPTCSTVNQCQRVLAWQIKDRHHLRVLLSYKRHADAMRALRLASAAFHVPLSQEVCIAKHESGLGNQLTPEPSSGASGLMQFLRSTWQHTPFYAYGFSVWDDDANALAAAQIVAHDGGWGQWSTRGICGL